MLEQRACRRTDTELQTITCYPWSATHLRFSRDLPRSDGLMVMISVSHLGYKIGSHRAQMVLSSILSRTIFSLDV
jgi:hypothetical protein